MDVAIARRETPDGLLLIVSGRLDAEHAGELARAVDEELRRGHHAIALDLTDCGFLSSAGIRVLFEIHRSAKDVGGSCLIRATSAAIRKVLDLARLTPLLMEPAAVAAMPQHAAHAPQPAAADLRSGGVQFLGLERPEPAPLRGRLVGGPGDVHAARTPRAERRSLSRRSFAVGLAALAEESPLAERAGEMLAACGTAFHRRPQPFSVVDYVAPTGDLVPEIDIGHGLVWDGMPQGRAGFEMADPDQPVAVDELVARLFEQTTAHTLAIVAAGEVHGLVGAELIRPLVEASATDRPGAVRPEIAARWLSFSREPVHARRTVVIVGVATRDSVAAPLADFVRPLGSGTVQGHFHAVVFPPRPLKRGAGDLAATVADIAASEPVALMHLLADPQPVLGSGRSALVRGRCWFAPLTLEGAAP